MNCRVIAVVGPSGVGKDTLMHMASALRPQIKLIRRVITRPENAGGEEFTSCDLAEFERRRAKGEFAIDWEAHGLRYGIPHLVDCDGIYLVNLSRSVLIRAAEIYSDLRVVQINAAPEILASRLAMRGRENDLQIRERVSRDIRVDETRLSVTKIDNSGTLNNAVTAFLAAIDEMVE